MSGDILPEVSAEIITTARLRTRVLTAGERGATAVLFLHGNLSSATWWEEVMTTLPPGFWAIAPDQRGFGDADPDAKINATRGVGDLVDDAVALLDHYGVPRAHVVANSMGGSVVWRLLAEHMDRVHTATQVAPGSPYGFGGTKDVSGTPCYSDFAGSGAGLTNPELIKRIARGDRSAASPVSPRSLLRALIVKPPFVPAREDALVDSMLSTHIGAEEYPGDSEPSLNWPFFAPGLWGVNNALSPKYSGDSTGFVGAAHKAPILWVRGSHDRVVSDRAAGDPGTWGSNSPDYPGAQTYPPQPMLAQTRAVLAHYAAHGGSYREVVIDNTAHVSFIEDLTAFNTELHEHLRVSHRGA